MLLLSQRGFNFEHWMPWVYELESVIESVDAVDVIELEPRFQGRVGRAWLWMKNRTRHKLGLPVDAGIRHVKLSGEYDLLFCIVNFAPDVALFRYVEGIRRHCKRAVVVILEVWTSGIQQAEAELRLLDQLEFDCVYATHSGVLDSLRRLSGRPVELFLFGVDCLRFAPYPVPAARVVDCYSMGRRSEVTHQGLLDWARRGNFFYIYDTIGRKGDVFQFRIRNWQEHRDLVASIVKRSRYFIAYSAQHRTDTETEPSLSPRYFEGAGGGAVMLGTAPGCPEFGRCFDWPDALVQIPYECPEIERVLDELEREPERLVRARRANLLNTLRRHDWSYRWEDVLRRVGMEPLVALKERHRKLAAMAEEIERWPAEALEPLALRARAGRCGRR